MAVQHVAIRQHDTAPPLEFYISHEDGSPFDLSSVNVVQACIRDAYTMNIVNHSQCTVLDAANGLVSYQWQTQDTANPGEFYLEFVVRHPAGRFSYPMGDYIRVQVIQNLLPLP